MDQTLQLQKHLRRVCIGSTLALTEAVGHVANQSEVFLEADLSVAVLIQSSLHLFDGRGAVCVLHDVAELFLYHFLEGFPI